jgi:signal transduction histidine kinase
MGDCGSGRARYGPGMRRARWVDARFGSLSPTRTDAALVVVLCLAWVVEVLANGSRPAPLAATLFAGWAMIAPVAWRRRAPAAALAAHGTLMGLSAAVGAGVLDGPHNVEGIAIAILIYSLGAYAQGIWLAAGVAVSLAIVTSHALLVGTSLGPGATLSLVAFVAAATLTGRALRQRRLLTRELEERAARLRADREARARSVADDERRRIAHEPHDVVTHVLGAMVVQASSLRRARPSEPGEIARTLGDIERSGREALAEMRRLLSVLRAGEGQPLAPAPTIDQVHRLAALTRERGLPVELRIEGRPRPLARSIDISAYRVVEDALQASLERGERRALVTLRYGPSDTEVEVTGEHPAHSSPAEAVRLRLAAIRERVAICAGELRSAEGQGGGFAVRARFPHNGHTAVASAGERTAGVLEAGLPPARRRDRRGWLVDAALAVAVLAALTLDAFSSGELRGSAALNEAVFVVMASAFAWRRRAPLAAAATVAIAAVALTAFLTPLPALQTGQGALVVMTYLAAAATEGRQAALAFGALGASVAAVMLVYGVPKLS